jgi:hypothetical protein
MLIAPRNSNGYGAPHPENPAMYQRGADKSLCEAFCIFSPPKGKREEGDAVGGPVQKPSNALMPVVCGDKEPRFTQPARRQVIVERHDAAIKRL